jgi:hypothetical protein
MESAGSPLYPKFRHFEASALRALPNPPPKALGTHGTAAEADREAWKLSLQSNPLDALAFAKAWGNWAWDRDLFEEAEEAYFNAQRAQTLLVLGETDLEARRSMLGNTSFATRGAYAFHKTGDVKQAVLLLEQTSLSAFNAPRQRSDLLRLEQVAPELKARLLDATNLQIEIHQRGGRDQFGALSPEETRVRAERDSIVAEIHKIRGFESFATSARWEDVVEATTHNPLVYVVPTDKGAVAVAVAPGKQTARTIAAVDIPVTTADVQAAYLAFVKAEYANEGDRRSALLALLEWLGSHVMIYVKALLIELSPEEGPFTLVPFGLFASLPIHLGIIHPSESRTQSLFHPRNVTFTYSSTGLAASQRKSHCENGAARALVVSNPRPIPPEFDSLLLSDFEARMVAEHFPIDMLAGRDADTKSVLDLLPAATVAHFSCHGTVDSRFGYSGVLLLANTESLNYEHMRMLPELQARLVVLSACRSGSAALGIEQCVNLPNAFLAAGSAAVLGTFWHTDELASLLLLTRFYEIWLDRETPRTPGQALGDAQAWLMTSSAQAFRAILKPDVLASRAAEGLRQADANARLFADPWFWGGFFIAGA